MSVHDSLTNRWHLVFWQMWHPATKVDFDFNKLGHRYLENQRFIDSGAITSNKATSIPLNERRFVDSSRPCIQNQNHNIQSLVHIILNCQSSQFDRPFPQLRVLHPAGFPVQLGSGKKHDTKKTRPSSPCVYTLYYTINISKIKIEDPEGLLCVLNYISMYYN